jgi:hypothetical protein
MNARFGPLFALSAVLVAPLLVSPVWAQAGAPQAASTAAAPAASPTPQPEHIKTLGHIYTSAFCSRFVEHFNGAAQVLGDNDRKLDAADADLTQIMSDYDRRDGASRVYNDRVKLIALVGEMQKSIPAGQRSINDLLAQAKTTSDSARRAALRESASQMQTSIDRQRAVAYDLGNVVHVLLDKHTAEDTAEYQINQLLPAGSPPVRVDALDQPVEEPGSRFGAPSFKASATSASLQEVMQFGRQRTIIAGAEVKASAAATRVLSTCGPEPARPLKP